MRQLTRKHDIAAGESPFASLEEARPEILDKDAFLRALTLERKRTERSGTPFLLMCVELTGSRSTDANLLKAAIKSIRSAARDTDIVGWYDEGKMAAAIYTGMTQEDRASSEVSISQRLISALSTELVGFDPGALKISFHIFPDQWVGTARGEVPDLIMYPDAIFSAPQRRSRLVAKRIMDIFGSLLLITVFSPLLLMIAMAVMLSSDGPILFRQSRVGRQGRLFTFLKFRSMYVNSDTAVHQQYIRNLIATSNEAPRLLGNAAPVYKMANDRRVTRVGRFLRRSSLDELPQLFNVLRGDMSLVGPRPPIPYEIEAYKPWHRSRCLLVQPGITGLWQVTGRSRVGFDEMVRLDLRYAMTWSLWTDIKLLLQTPAALLKGAY